jgi:hypothetical protein
MDYAEMMKAAGNDVKGPAIPAFYVEAQENGFRTKQTGRPQYDDVEMVRIITPGDNKNIPVERVNDEHKARWPKEYEAFKAGIEAPLEGTPLAEWPPISRSQVAEFAHFNIRSVEQLAALGDHHLQNLGMGARELRAQAKTFLEVAEKGTAPIARMLAESQRKDDEIAILKRQLEEAAARIKELEATPNASAAA